MSELELQTITHLKDMLNALNRIADALEKLTQEGIVEKKIILQGQYNEPTKTVEKGGVGEY